MTEEEWKKERIAYLKGRRNESEKMQEESKLGGCYNLLCHTEKVQGEKKIVELQEEVEKLEKRIYDQTITIAKLFPCASIDESEEEQNEQRD